MKWMRKLAVAIFACPDFYFGEGANILLENIRRRGFRGVHDDDDFNGAGGPGAPPERIQRGKEIWFVEARDDDDHAEIRMRLFGDKGSTVLRETEALEIVSCGRRQHY